MGELTINKFVGSLLAAALVLFGLRELAHVVFAPPYHADYGHEGETKSLNEQFAEKYAYFVEVSEQVADGEPEPVFDLGLALLAADPSSGQRAFAAKCAICHTVDAGGANGTGPNLHAIMGVNKNHAEGFNYSGALSSDQAWTYDAMNEWLYNPSAYASGTSMAFAGLRRDGERADVIAYLAQITPNAPAFPEPLPVADEVEGEDMATDPAVEPAAADAPAETAPVEAVPAETVPAEPVSTEAAPIEAAVEAVEDAAADVEAAVDDTDLVEEAVEAAETLPEDAVLPESE